MERDCFSYQKTKVLDSPSHKKHGRFINPWEPDTKRRLRNVFLWQMGFYNDKNQNLDSDPNFQFPDEHVISDNNTHSYARWMNHSTFMIELDGLVFLTDPIFAKRASPLPFIGPKRRIEPSIQLKELPNIDVLLISHNHYDHFDSKAISYLIKRNPNMVVFVPIGLRNMVLKLGVKRIFELDWWERIVVKDQKNRSYIVTAVPAQHCSGRRLYDRDKTLWCGYVVESTIEERKRKRFYFVGDTGYNSHDFAKIGEVFQHIDLSIIPIGCYIPKKFMSPVHIGPEEAVSIHKEVFSAFTLASHFGTFKLSSESLSRPAYDLYLALKKEGLSPMEFSVPQQGKRYSW